MSADSVSKAYDLAKEHYASFGVDTEAALDALAKIPLSLHCWQGDDLAGFEKPGASLSGGGIAVTGNYPGKARNINELRSDLTAAFSLIPGAHRLNLHAMYGDFGPKGIEREDVRPEHFRSWVDFACERNLALDFNATCYSHPMAAGGFTLASRDGKIRRFWIDYLKRCREIGAWMGASLKTPCLHNLWIPDGSKDATVNRFKHREILRDSLDEIFAVRFPAEHLKDSVEAKLFGIGTESFVVGSHEFYLGWAAKNKKILCLDMGHFHPTESVADKISALLLFLDELLIHVSRGVRWDSDHVVIFNDELQSLMQEIVRANALPRVHFALDYFDAELNRVGAWVSGARSTQKALLFALLEPAKMIRECEERGDNFGRLALFEESKSLPFGAVWDHFCEKMNVPHGRGWITAVLDYETRVLRHRI